MKIVAVIATFNRCQLLERTINALLNQTLKVDDIVVVNNASTDGTSHLLQSYEQIAKNLHIISLTENIGGAGAFHVGMEYGLKLQSDYIFLQDDDGFLDLHCLEQLTTSMEELDAVTPLILDEMNTDKLSFDINGISDAKYFLDEKILPGVLKPFNGLLIKTEIVRLIGLPISKYFIWGDETEYRLRMDLHDVRYGTNVSAHMFHPKNQLIKTTLFGITFIVPNSDLRTFCFYRNYLHIYKSYKKFSAKKLFLKYLLFNILTLNQKNLVLLIKAYLDMKRNNFSRHADFIK